jgi:hypothetical protein
LFLFITLLFMGCKKPMEHPENSDPVFNDIRKQSGKVFIDYKNKEKDVQSAKKAYEEAPIRTGQRQETHDEYFNQLNELQKLGERYRYLALKLEDQRKFDIKLYHEGYKTNEEWPNSRISSNYELEKRLANAPREWSPENRIRERELSKEKARMPAATSEKSE